MIRNVSLPGSNSDEMASNIFNACVSKITYKWSTNGHILAFKAARLLKYNTHRIMSLLPSGRRSQTSKAGTANSKPCYPGLGLPLRYEWKEPFFPIGAHGGCWGAKSVPINVREVAMMNVMEVLTDKVDWHVKVNDESIVSKWRSEALAIPNTHWWDIATSAKRQHWEADGFVQLQPDHHFSVKVPENILSPESFDYVCYCTVTNSHAYLFSALQSFAARPGILRRQASCLL